MTYDLFSPTYISELRQLLYPFGSLALLAFGSRFIVQWFWSEYQGRSESPLLFWLLSMVGNGILIFHSFIQGQFAIYFCQLIQITLGWRNVNLRTARPISFISFFTIFLVTTLLGIGVYISQLLLLHEASFSWARSPKDLDIAPWIHCIGACALFSFSLRFIVQWIFCEQQRESFFAPSFWYISLFGACFSSIYFFLLADWIQLTSSVCGIIPYIRNLMLIERSKGQAV